MAPPAQRRQRFFTVESANRALVLVRKIVEDVVGAYNELMRLRSKRQELTLTLDAQPRLDELRTQIEQRAGRLKQLAQELASVGCELKDFARGRVDFPARLEAREIFLCWQLGEPELAYWHEPDAGFKNRQPIGSDFPLRTSQVTLVRTQAVKPH
jgi:hypothetical protein